jgi:transcription initiation factor TFIIH subunit 1
LEEKNRMFQEDPELFQLYKELVVSKVISAEEFWNNHNEKQTKTPSACSASRPTSASPQQKQLIGVSAAFLADINPQLDGANGLKYNLTPDIIESIFRTYPAVRDKYVQHVPHNLTGEFQDQADDCRVTFRLGFAQPHPFLNLSLILQPASWLVVRWPFVDI